MTNSNNFDETIDSFAENSGHPRQESPEFTAAFTPGAGAGPPSADHDEPPQPTAAEVRFLSRSHGGFQGETAGVLRVRLLAYTIVTSGILALGFAVSLVTPTPAFWMRVVVLSVISGIGVLLRGAREFSLRQLRCLEITCVSALLTQLLVMAWYRQSAFVVAGDDVSTVAAIQYLNTLCCLVIVAYGFFIPNTWLRASLVMLPIAAIPPVFAKVAIWLMPGFAELVNGVELSKSIPETGVAAAIAIYGSHVIQGVRREAFRAKQLGQYMLKGVIGSGGMGDVYRAEHRMLKRPCAIKLIRPGAKNSLAAIDRFETEVQATAKLSHWNSIEVYDYGRTDDGTFYYVMELLPGASLEEILRRHGPLAPGRVVHFLMQICDALAEAHEQGLVHRDIKPANLFAAHRGGLSDVAKLLDFGLVRQSSDGTTATSGFSGTPHYMAPEQATDYAAVDGRADIYALGAVAYALLTGSPPFPGSVSAALSGHQRGGAKPLSQINPELPADLCDVVMNCLQKIPDDRFQSAVELHSALGQCVCASAWTQKDAREWWRNHTFATDVSPQDLAGQPTSKAVDTAATTEF